ncbi:PREDICTED: uncharacterized protein LOC109584872 [Amphimedon queenslandica]|uniref:Death domain-containing protein n=1 Tax=Amphimedon queenslandica TaxID=400682 RepID=A0A1X7U3W1_AMPQE|nr:PREDICTED: uncharacterized protein LOC109584872 [Amphimedon queenslandica]|eukprot:XP_019856330.1 PREDICTED: uncharacterized protein LOC109584872 [Amphimedon queenslandica]
MSQLQATVQPEPGDHNELEVRRRKRSTRKKLQNDVYVRAGSWRDLSTNEMSYGSQRKIAAFLDSSHTLNWKDLLSTMPEYGPLQMQQLSQQEVRGKSPTISLLSHMASRGRTVGQLYDFCNDEEEPDYQYLICERTTSNI